MAYLNRALTIGLVALALVGCQTKTQSGMLAGGALGAGTGALIDGGTGALIGGAIGTIGGALIGSVLDAQDRAIMEQRHPQTLEKIDHNKQLSEDDIVKMSKAGIADDTIIAMIQKTNSSYTLTTEKVHHLEREGVSQKVINYMIST